MSQLPDYVASAQPNPSSNRAGWLATTAATYAGVMLWFVFWSGVPGGGEASIAGGTLSQGLPLALGSLIVAAFVCHYLFYYVPGMLGMKTGLPLYIVGTSTYGAAGGFLMPGFLMGVLQFGWLSVNGYFAGLGLTSIIKSLPMDHADVKMSAMHLGIGIAWAAGAAFVGLKGISYVGKVASFTPIIPIVVLLYLLAKTVGGVSDFDPAKTLGEAGKGVELYGSGQLGVLSLMCAYVVGFFATAGAAGCDFGSNNKNAGAVQMGGLVGIVLVTIFTGGIALLVVAGSQGMQGVSPSTMNPLDNINTIIGPDLGKIFMLLLALAAFPSACFSSFIAANSFKTTLPKVNPFITCGIGTLAACYLIYSGFAGQAGDVFTLIGASFGPVCGAMMADYWLAGCKWAGPRAGFNPAGWLSWIVGFVVGGITLFSTKFVPFDLPCEIPCPPIAAFVVGFVLYALLAKMGMQSKVLDMPQRIDDKEVAPE